MTLAKIGLTAVMVLFGTQAQAQLVCTSQDLKEKVEVYENKTSKGDKVIFIENEDGFQAFIGNTTVESIFTETVHFVGSEGELTIELHLPPSKCTRTECGPWGKTFKKSTVTLSLYGKISHLKCYEFFN